MRVLLVALALGWASAGWAQAPLETRTTIQGCGSGVDETGQGSRLITWFSEVVIFRAASGLPVRHAWITMLNPTLSVQTVTLTTLEAATVVVPQTATVVLQPRTRVPIDLGALFWVSAPRADFGLEVLWQTYGKATVSLWDEGFAFAEVVPGVNGCYEAWRNPYR